MTTINIWTKGDKKNPHYNRELEVEITRVQELVRNLERRLSNLEDYGDGFGGYDTEELECEILNTLNTEIEYLKELIEWRGY